MKKEETNYGEENGNRATRIPQADVPLVEDLSRSKRDSRGTNPKTILASKILLVLILWGGLLVAGFYWTQTYLEDSRANLNQQITEIKQENEQKLASIASELADKEKTLEQMSRQLSLIKEQLSLADQTLSGTNQTRKALEEKIKELDKQLDELRDSLQKLEDAARVY